MTFCLSNFQRPRWPGYSLGRELGRGSFGVVYQATKRDGKVCALKMVQDDGSPFKRKYQEGEIDVIKKDLNHDNIVLVYEYFANQAIIYIAMELCEGGDLNDHFVKTRPDVKEKFEIMVDLARGLNYLHNQGIIHRDIKPKNILLKQTNGRFVCKITDFGIARIETTRGETFSTCTGSLAYTAPEMQDGSEYSNSVDIFALGLLYFAVYNSTVLTNDQGTKALIPGEENAKGSIIFLNGKLRKYKPSKDSFLETYSMKLTRVLEHLYILCSLLIQMAGHGWKQF